MALRTKLAAPPAQAHTNQWHQVESASLHASLLMTGDRRMEAENYLSEGFRIRAAIERDSGAWSRFETLADVRQPSRLKGVQVSRDFGKPYLAATQVLEFRPVPRKWLSLERIREPDELIVAHGTILVTRSGSVGRATVATIVHEGSVISDDLFRVFPRRRELRGQIYAFLRSAQARSMMISARYGHIIKHLEISHVNPLPVPQAGDELSKELNAKFDQIVELRSRAVERSMQAEQLFARAVGMPAANDWGEAGFSVSASETMQFQRRRMDAWPHTPAVRGIRVHLRDRSKAVVSLVDAGFEVWLPTRFRRIPASNGIELLDSSDLFEVNPDISKRIADGDFGDPFSGRVRKGWLLLSRSGQVYGLIGSLVIATEQHEGKIISDHII